MAPLLTVIVPVYNSAPYLRDCLDSILGQSYSDLEVIAIDDGSSDSSGQILDDHARKDCRLRVIHQTNQGQAIARNAGLSLAMGEYITFVDSDDRLDIDLFDPLMAQAPFEMMIFGCTKIESVSGKTIQVIPPAKTDTLDWRMDGPAFIPMFRSSLFGYACSKIYHRSVVAGLSFRDIKLREDLLFNLEASRKIQRLHISDHAGYFYLIHPSSTLQRTYQGPVPDIIETAKYFLTVHPDLDPITDRIISGEIIRTYLLDALHKYVFMNHALTDAQRRDHLSAIVRDAQLRKHLSLQNCEGTLHRILVLSYKLRCPSLLFHFLRSMWKK